MKWGMDMTKQTKLMTALVLNVLVIVLEVAGLATCWGCGFGRFFEFYTDDSNVLALVSSICYVVAAVLYLKDPEREIPHWVKVLRFCGSAVLMVTFLVVAFVLAPMAGMGGMGDMGGIETGSTGLLAGYRLMAWMNEFKYFHLFCPLLSLVSFIFFEDGKWLRKADIPYTWIFTLIYGVILVILNIVGVVSGPYPFLMVRENPIFVSVLSVIGIFALIAFLGWALWKLNRKFAVSKE